MSISAVSSAPVHTAEIAPPKAPPAPPTEAKVDSDGDHDGGGSSGSAGHLNIKA